uniref:Uncharacterized protein n=1 Tax=Haptolina ericina TaxID=156174 RepID=A0A7S3AS52_9EUKA|eukprot:CAMPEP_0181230834 /NCGR_PEP_ID=MMETSP1096-20121128/34718_1 /TAXON_ID=156174 ORGANISM="Chrysochromulina ericina, Strain CCMP281" /NCGR_SAMPLE_ID=MMETSP1096 /ASSEMBLY_ACC=CAM_ASM_000453 /LENGTH=149 /DNA_ID=CAMNT_0023324703 /DNA_START=33 /DNA_END=482 /DNA_ORIENTATION=-
MEHLIDTVALSNAGMRPLTRDSIPGRAAPTSPDERYDLGEAEAGSEAGASWDSMPFARSTAPSVEVVWAPPASRRILSSQLQAFSAGVERLLGGGTNGGWCVSCEGAGGCSRTIPRQVLNLAHGTLSTADRFCFNFSLLLSSPLDASLH